MIIPAIIIGLFDYIKKYESELKENGNIPIKSLAIKWGLNQKKLVKTKKR